MARRRLCRLEEIADGAARGFAGDEADAADPGLIVIRRGQEVYGYLNTCPHLYISLDFMPGRFVVQGRHIQCANHGARFRISDGFCVFGPCQGKSLVPAPVRVRDGVIEVAD